MDWWFDIDNKICRVEMTQSIFKKPTITFGGELGGVLIASKRYKNGVTYIYETENNHTVSINDVVYRGERYVSLYVDRRLIKEYCVNAQVYSGKYMENPRIYDSSAAFVKLLTCTALLCALFFAVFSSALLTFLGIIDSYAALLAMFGMSFFALALISAAAIYAIYAHNRRMMARYAIISSIKRRKKKTARAGFWGATKKR